MPFSRRQTPRACVCLYDLDLDPMTLINELDLNNLKTCMHSKNEVSRSTFSKVRAQKGQTNTATDSTETITMLQQTRVVKISTTVLSSSNTAECNYVGRKPREHCNK